MLVNDKISTSIVTLLIILYAALAAPSLPNSVILFFDTWYGKLLFMFLIGFVASHNIQVALTISILFMIILNLATRLESSKEHFYNVTNVIDKSMELDEDMKKFIDWYDTPDVRDKLNNNTTDYGKGISNLLFARTVIYTEMATAAMVPRKTVKKFIENIDIDTDFTKNVNEYKKAKKQSSNK
jgi:hypothetical protein